MDENVLKIVLDKEAADKAAKLKAQEKRDVAEIKRAEAVKRALQKITFCPNGLTVPEMKTLVSAATRESDLPDEKKKSELQQQLYHEPRYARVQAMVGEFQLTINAAAVEALVSLQAYSSSGQPD